MPGRTKLRKRDLRSSTWTSVPRSRLVPSRPGKTAFCSTPRWQKKTNLRRHDIVVMTVRQISAGAGEFDLADNQLFTDWWSRV